MGSNAENEERATPKLSLSKLPSKQREPPLVMFTPPIKTLASIPFQWEEAPGKARSHFTPNSNKSTAAIRCLELPPRLLNTTADPKVMKVNVSSPTTVLDGPYSYGGGRSFSHNSTCSSFPKGSFRNLEEEIVREVKFHGINGKRDHLIKERSSNFASWRWGSFKENSKSSFDYFSSSSSSVSFASKSNRSGAKLPPRFKRRTSSVLSFSQASSNLLAGIYGSFKQVVHWRRRQRTSENLEQSAD